jgi:hypothetical protein
MRRSKALPRSLDIALAGFAGLFLKTIQNVNSFG